MYKFHLLTNFIFKTGAYNFGYEVGPHGQFHHEKRGPDGVTYGCYGYIDPNGLLRVTHYVADSHGYRVIEPQKPVEVYAVTAQEDKAYDPEKGRHVTGPGQIFAWRDLYLPKGCGMVVGGIRPDVVVKPLPGGGFAPVEPQPTGTSHGTGHGSGPGTGHGTGHGTGPGTVQGIQGSGSSHKPSETRPPSKPGAGHGGASGPGSGSGSGGTGVGGSYKPDNSGNYNHVTGPNGPNGPGSVPGGDYNHVTGPNGGSGGNGRFFILK